MSDPIQQSLFTINDAAPARSHPSTEAPHPTPVGHDRGQPHLGTEILQCRHPVGPPPSPPAFDLVDGGYRQEQVDEHLRQLTTWSRRESTRADSAELTLRAVVQRLHHLEANPATRIDADPATQTTTPASLTPPSSDEVSAQLAGSAPDAADPADSSVQPPQGARHRPRRTPASQVDRPPDDGPHRSRWVVFPSASVRATRPRQRWVLIAAVIVLMVGAAGYGWLLEPAPGNVKPAPGNVKPAAGNADAVTARLTLTTSPVKIGDSYFATARGFLPGEKVQISWTGPTSGRMDPIPTDLTGTAVQGPIIERDPPGNYLLIVTGLTSGRSATEPLQVVTGADATSATTPNPRVPGGHSRPGRTDG